MTTSEKANKLSPDEGEQGANESGSALAICMGASNRVGGIAGEFAKQRSKHHGSPCGPKSRTQA